MKIGLIESAIFKYFPPTFYEVAIPQFYLWYLIKISIVPIYFFLIHSSNHPWTKFTSEKINSYFLKPSCEEQKEVDLLRVLGRLLHKKRWNVEESDHRMMTGFTPIQQIGGSYFRGRFCSTKDTFWRVPDKFADIRWGSDCEWETLLMIVCRL